MRSNAPKVKRNETMTLSDRKHFQNFEKNPKTGQCLAGQCFADYCIKTLKVTKNVDT